LQNIRLHHGVQNARVNRIIADNETAILQYSYAGSAAPVRGAVGPKSHRRTFVRSVLSAGTR